MNDTSSMQVVLAVFAAVERRDQAAFARSCQPDAEFCWPPSLPYGRTVRGLTDRAGAGWEAYWNPLQPTAGHRRLDPRVIAATEEEVVDPASVISFLAKAIPAGPDQATGAEDPSAGARQRSRQGRRALRVQGPRPGIRVQNRCVSATAPREVTQE